MIYILLPAFNEERNLGAEVRGIDRACRGAGLAYEVVVVDDGSTDGTASEARVLAARFPVRLLSHGRNRGLGPAMRTAIAFAVARAAPNDCIVTKDADNSQDPSLLPSLCRLIEEGTDLVIASRYRPGGREIGLAPHRRLLSRGASVLLRVLCPIAGVRDFTCGYRAFRAGTLARAWDDYAPYGGLVERTDFSCTLELLLKVARLTDRITELPLVLRYDLKAGPSKMQIWRTVRGNLAVALRARCPVPSARCPAGTRPAVVGPGTGHRAPGTGGA